MWPVPKPQASIITVFADCISDMQDKEIKNKIASHTHTVEGYCTQFELSAHSGQLYLLKSTSSDIGDFTSSDFTRILYDNGLRGRASGRAHYDKLICSAPLSQCPLCGIETVSTLDHYLPKSKFPLLCIAPTNLVPACQTCNMLKRDKFATTPGEQTFHPYFDNIDSESWIGSVFDNKNLLVEFFVDAPPYWTSTQKARANRHFEVFNLAYRYSTVASRILADQKNILENLYSATGTEGVADYLRDQSVTRIRRRRNGPEQSTFNALSKSHWFCSGGFSKID